MRPLAYLCLLLATALPAADAPGLAVTDAWVRAVPGSTVAAAYFTARNSGAQPLTIIGIRSPVATQAMIHETALVGTQSTMRPHERLPLAPGQSVQLTPGGMHVMLMGLRQPLQPGAQVQLVLILEGGTSVAVLARVRALGEE